MNWINVKDSLPDCHSQHGRSFTSDQVLVVDKYGEYGVNQYWKEYNKDITELIKERWLREDIYYEIVAWCEIPHYKHIT